MLAPPELLAPRAVEGRRNRDRLVNAVSAAKPRAPPNHVGPFRKALPPPLVVVWRWMELRKVKRDQFSRSFRGRHCTAIPEYYRLNKSQWSVVLTRYHSP